MRNRGVLLIFTNAMILIVVFALLTQSLVVMQRIAVADQLTGRVEVQRNGRGEWKALAQKDAIKTGDVVRTADGSAEFKWLDGTRWKVMPNSQITVKKATSSRVKKADQTQLKLTAGKVFVRIVKTLTPESKFEIETPTAVAAVRGTIFSVAVADGKTQVAVFKGQVNVQPSGGGNATAIVPGQAVIAAESALHTQQSSAADFLSEPNIIKPPLDATLKLLDDKRILIKGQTEAGDEVRINGDPVTVLGNGVFMKRIKAAPDTTFTIISTDKHGQSTTISRTLPAKIGCTPPTENAG